MKNLKSVSIKIENPSLRQRYIIITTNFLLWLIIKIFRNDENKMAKQIRGLIKSACKDL